MTSRDQKYVLQALYDLIGLHVYRRRGPVDLPLGQLPAGVTARLALVWAGGQDAALLSGGAARGNEATQIARRQLLTDAIARAGEVDVLGPVSLQLRCGRARHTVRLDTDGTVVPLAHPDVDMDAERVAASLGGELLPCLRAVDEAAYSWAPPVADDGPRLAGGIETGELLAFVLTVRTWLGAGHGLLSCAPALELGVPREEIARHLDLGLDVPTAVHWRAVVPSVAVRWQAVGFSRSDVELWCEQGRTLEQAEQAAAAAGDGRWLARWARIAGSGQSAEALAEWAAFGVPVGVWGEAASRGLRAPEVPAWLAAGFQPVEVLRYAHLRVHLAQAVRWQQAGFTAYVATGCLGVGMTLADACALRGLPTKQVQQLWTECGSVEAVLEATASMSTAS